VIGDHVGQVLLRPIGALGLLERCLRPRPCRLCPLRQLALDRVVYPAAELPHRARREPFAQLTNDQLADHIDGAHCLASLTVKLAGSSAKRSPTSPCLGISLALGSADAFRSSAAATAASLPLGPGRGAGGANNLWTPPLAALAQPAVSDENDRPSPL